MKHRAGKTIALILANIHSGSSLKILPPLLREVQKTEHTLYLFPGGRLEANETEERLRNKIYSLIAESVDGVISWASSLGGVVNQENLTDFHHQFDHLPMVTMAHEIPGKPVVRIDAYSALFSLLDHFYSHHGVRRFAFIQGPQEHFSAQDRLRAFRDFHHKKQLPLAENCISSPFGWNEGDQAIQELMDSRHLMPGKDFEALIACSDLQLYRAVEILQRRGFKIPHDILVGGFNNSIESKIAFPPFTTVDSPVEDQAIIALRELLRLFTGQAITSRRDLQGSLIIRRSCGCIPQLDIYDQLCVQSSKCDETYSSQLNEFLSTDTPIIAQILGIEREEQEAWIVPLLEAFKEACLGEPNHFHDLLETLIERHIQNGRDIASWQTVITYLIQRVQRSFPESLQETSRIMLDKARLIISEGILRMHQVYEWTNEQQWTIIRKLERDLINVQNRTELSGVLHHYLPFLGIEKGYVIETSASGEGWCIAGFDRQGPLELVVPLLCEGGKFLPPSLFPQDPGSIWVIEPLISQRQFLGWAVLRMGVSTGTVYEEIRSALSNSLMSLRAIENLRQAQKAAEQAEKIKSRFLAHVSQELLQPLERITTEIDTLGKQKRSEGIQATIGSIKEELHHQARLVKDILELSRAEVGDLRMEGRLFSLGFILKKLQEDIKKQSPLFQIEPPITPPLLIGDGRRIEEILTTLASLWSLKGIFWKIEENYLVLTIYHEGPLSTSGTLHQETALLLAQRIVAAHEGMLEYLQEGDNQGWLLKFPLPQIQGKGSLERTGAILMVGISSEMQLPPLVTKGSVKKEFITLSELFDKKDLYGSATLLIVYLSHLSAEDMVLLYTILKDPLFQTIPLALFPRDDTTLVAGESVLSYLSEKNALPQEKVILLYRFHGELKRETIVTLSRLNYLDIQIAEDPEELAIKLKKIRRVHLILCSELPSNYEEILELPSVRDGAPPFVILSEQKIEENLVEQSGAKGNCLLLNAGIYQEQEFLSLLKRLLEGKSLLPPYTGILVKRALLYLNQHYQENILRWKLAEYVHISEDYLSRIFKKEIGMSPWEYLIRLRISMAKKLLIQKTATISEIAEMVGFSDQAYFCRVFKKYTGRSPLSYRRKEGQPKEL
ncbi:MAG TPA: helix-turn-helix domain-containing protein [Termitinemataceae bacterium]|nr:helix-turn-helix domain-containing protein [Termitinemataceae bacterium]HOM23388.1 helix-turn-helix domain-containing protein [Termitinemataceae bacterium]HPQ01251.1 helix-turn-helix domain-containing protein [Termitinemataceae bacterium]